MTRSSRGARVLVCAAIAAVAWLAAAPSASAQSVEGSFDRTLKVTGPVDLTITSGSGRIHVTPGAADTVRVSARVRGGTFWFGTRDVTARIREIEKNPPIEQSGNTIRIGRFADESLQRNISISYEVTVPAQASVNARTGSGGVEIGDLAGRVEAHSGSGGIRIGRVAGVVEAATGSGGIEVDGAASLSAHSGSGSIRAAGIGGTATARAGSGGIRLAHVGKGDVDVSSSSGTVVVTGVDGSARVSASSGGIDVEGRPSGPWAVHSSSGTVTLRLPGDAAFDIDAHVSSGQIDSAHPVTMSGRIERRRLQGKVRGGGPLVEVSSASGGIRIR
jgi:hypothetical protein